MTLHKGVDISNWQKNVDYKLLAQKGYDTIIINCGGADQIVSQATPNSALNLNYTNARNNNFKTGFYFFVYWNASPKAQAQEFFNNIQGKISDTRFFLDIESKTEAYGDDSCKSIDILAQEIIQEMQQLALNQNLTLKDDAFAIYSPSSFATIESNSLEKYGLWLADTNISNEPTESSIPWAIVNGKYVTFKNWIGWQWNTTGINGALGLPSLDVDVFKEECYLTTAVTIGTTTGTIGSKTTETIASKSTSDNLSVGDYIKIISGTNFAPNLIPSSDKGIKYTIDSIDGSMCKLSGINEWVNFEFLNLIQSSTPVKPKSPSTNSNNLSWDNLPLETKTAIFIASNEGFSPGSYPSGGEIGYSTGNYQQYMQGIKLPITPMNGITLIERWISPQISTWNKWINHGGLSLNNLTDNQKIALYDFAYNTGGAIVLSQLSNCISTRTATFNNTFGSFEYVSNPTFQQGIDNRRKSEFNMYFNGPSFGSSVSELPSQYYTFIKNL